MTVPSRSRRPLTSTQSPFARSRAPRSFGLARTSLPGNDEQCPRSVVPFDRAGDGVPDIDALGMHASAVVVGHDRGNLAWPEGGQAALDAVDAHPHVPGGLDPEPVQVNAAQPRDHAEYADGLGPLGRDARATQPAP